MIHDIVQTNDNQVNLHVVAAADTQQKQNTKNSRQKTTTNSSSSTCNSSSTRKTQKFKYTDTKNIKCTQQKHSNQEPNKHEHENENNNDNNRRLSNVTKENKLNKQTNEQTTQTIQTTTSTNKHDSEDENKVTYPQQHTRQNSGVKTIPQTDQTDQHSICAITTNHSSTQQPVASNSWSKSQESKVESSNHQKPILKRPSTLFQLDNFETNYKHTFDSQDTNVFKTPLILEQHNLSDTQNTERMANIFDKKISGQHKATAAQILIFPYLCQKFLFFVFSPRTQNLQD